MDPPSYGRGANGEVWDIEKDLDNLITLCSNLLSSKPLFFLINSYTGGLTKEVINNLLKLRILPKYNGKVEIDEIGLAITEKDLILPCGITGRVEFYE
jgi:23S rRNA (cytosine1962-C5)-methyltransferase